MLSPSSRDQINILELGSGPGLSGLFAASHFTDAHVYMSDICTKSLKLIKQNIELNRELLPCSLISVNYLEWGAHAFKEDLCEYYDDPHFPTKLEH